MAAQTFYVDFDNGNDGNGGTTPVGDAWKTFQHAADTADPGSGTPITVWFRPGMTDHYTARLYIDTHAGTGQSDRITFVADRFGQIWGDAGEAKITSTDAVYVTLHIVNKNYITIRGFEIIPSVHGINVGGNTDYVIIEENFVHDDIGTGRVWGIIDSNSSPYIQENEHIIRNNIIANLTASATDYGGGVQLYYRKNCYVYNNTVYDISTGNDAVQQGSCIDVVSNGASLNYATTATVKNNIFQKALGTNTNGNLIRVVIYNGTTGFSLTSDYNQFHRDGADYTASIDAATYVSLANWQGTGRDANSQEGDPQLVNPGGTNREDYQLKGTSPCRDAGVVTAGVVVDGVGTKSRRPRNNATNDIGAHQYGVPKIL